MYKNQPTDAEIAADKKKELVVKMLKQMKLALKVKEVPTVVVTEIRCKWHSCKIVRVSSMLPSAKNIFYYNRK
jgi:hypothetical protein